MSLQTKLISVCVVLISTMSACAPVIDQQDKREVVVFGVFSGRENGKNVLTSKFGLFANDVKLLFFDDNNFFSRIEGEIQRSGFFSVRLPVGEYSVHVRMPNRQVDLAHNFRAEHEGKAYYLGHLYLEIERKNIFFLLGACGYGSVEDFSVRDELVPTMERFVKQHSGLDGETEKRLLTPIDGADPSVNLDCSFLH